MTEMPGDASAGRLYAEVVSDTSGFAAEAKRKINAEVKGIRAKIKAELDTRGLAASAKRSAAEASNAAVVRVKAEVDTRGFVSSVKRAATEASRAAVVKVKLQVDDRGFTSKVVAAARDARKVAETQSKVKFTADTSALTTEVVAAAEAARRAAGGDVKVGADTSSARRELGALEGAAENTATSVAKIPAAFGGGGGGMGSARGMFGMLSKLIGTGPAILVVGAAVEQLAVAAVHAVGGLFSMGSAASYAVGTLAALPNLIGVAVQGLGSLVLGFSGVSEAVQALGATEQAQAQASTTAAAERKAAQERVAAAHQAVRDAARQVGEAERGVADAQRAAAAASRAIEDAQRRVADAHRGVADALRELHRVQQDVPEERADAVESVRDAVESLSDAETAYTRAQADTLAAQQAINDARAEARQRIHDLNSELEHSATAESGAALALTEARQALADVGFDPTSSRTDRRAAQQAVKEAQDNLDRVREHNKQLAKDTKKANEEGVKGSDEVRAAREQLTAAQEAESDALEAQRDAVESLSDARTELARTETDGARQIADAERDLADAHREVAEAQRGVTDARRNFRDAERGVADARRAVRDAERGLVRARRDLTQAERDAKKPAEAVTTALDAQKAAFEHLSPAGRKFARFIYGLRGRMYKFRNAVQQALLPPIQRGIKKALPLLDTLQEGLVVSARKIGRLGERLGKLFGSKGFRKDVEDIMRSNNKALGRFGDAGFNIVQILRDIGHEARPLVKRFSTWVDDLFKGWRKTIHMKRETGELRKFFDKAGDAAETLGDIVGNIFGTIGGLGKAAAPSGKSLLDSLNDATQRWEDWVNSKEGQRKLKEFFENAKDLTKELGKLIANVSQFVGEITAGDSGKGFTSFLKGLNAIIKAVNKLLELPGLGQALFGNPIANTVEMVKTSYHAIVNGAKWVWDKLFGHSIFPDIVQGFKDWAGDVRRFLGDEWDKATGWITAPIGAAKDGVSHALDKITDRFGDIRDWVADRWSNGWDKVTGWMSDPVGSARKNIGEGWDKVQNRFSDIRDWVANRWSRRWDSIQKWMEDPVANAKSGISGILTNIKNAFDTTVSAIGRIWSGLQRLAATPVNFLIDTVYNQGIRGLVNKVLGFFGSDKELPEIAKISTGGRGFDNSPTPGASGGVDHPGQPTRGLARGGILPGYTPGRDVHTFVSPTGGTLGLSGGEPVMRPEFGRAVGADWVARFNDIARRKGVNGVRKAMVLMGEHAMGGIMRLARFARGGIIDPTKKVMLDGEPLTRISAAQILLARRLSGIPMRVMQGSWQPYTSYSGSSHTGPGGVADTSPGNFNAQKWLRKVAMHGWGRNFPGAAQAGSGAHVHSISQLDPTQRNNSQLAAGGDGLGQGPDYGPNPPPLKGLRDMLARFGPLPLTTGAGGGGGGGGGMPWLIQKLMDGVGQTVSSLADHLPGGGFGGLLGTSVDWLWDQVEGWVNNKFASAAPAAYKGGTSGAVKRFTSIVKDVLGRLHQPQSALGAVLHRMNQESSGNTGIVNNWDSNAATGHPSVGLMQLIGGTYQAYKPRQDRGPYKYGVSTDPFSNIYAGVNYGANDSYHGYDKRSLASVMMQPGGYDDGGYLYPPINQTGQPEAVLDNEETEAFKLLAQVAAQMRRGTIEPAAPAGDAPLVGSLSLSVGDRRDIPEGLRLVDHKLRVIRRGGVHARKP